MRSRFLWKLYAGYAVVILVSIGLLGALVAHRVESETIDETDRRLRSEAMLLAMVVGEVGNSDAVEGLQDQLVELGTALGTRLTLIANDGRVLADSERDPDTMDNHRDRPEVAAALAGRMGNATRFSKTLGAGQRYVALPSGSQQRWVVRTSVPLTALEERLDQLRRAVVVASSGAVAVALLLGFWHARRVSRPLLSMAQSAAEITAASRPSAGHDLANEHVRSAAGDAIQSAASHSDEIGTLARSFSAMRRELHDSLSAVTSERNKLTAILASMAEGVIAVDRDERIVHMNQVAGQLLGLDPEAVVSHPIWQATRTRGIAEALSEAMTSETQVDREVRLAGSPDRVLAMHASPLLAKGRLAGAVLVLDDITHLRHLETIRQDFVGNVSHELKTPVTAIRGQLETLLDDPDGVPPKMRQRFLGKALIQTERMASLVSDLLSLSRIESTEEYLERVAIDLQRPVAAAVYGLQPAAEKRSVGITTEQPDHPMIIEGDEEAVRQAVSNLLDNAVKFSPPGGVVEVRLQENDGMAVVEVEDHGIGIAAAHRERLFERFYRVDKARSRQLGGTGLGLAIVKHIAIAHGGEVSVSSEPGRGSIFRIRLPLSGRE